MGRNGVHQEPRPAADGGDVAEGDGGDPGAPRGRAASVGGALLGGRHASEGLGFDEELPAEAQGRAAGRRWSRRSAAGRRPRRCRPPLHDAQD